MEKIPVFEIFGETYGFAFRRYFSLLGIVWLPMLALGAVGWFVFAPMVAMLPGLFAQLAKNAQDPAAMQVFAVQINALAGRVYLFDIVEIVVLSIMATGIVKEALGRRSGPAFVYLSVNRADLMVIGGMFLLILIYFAYMIGVVIAAAIAGGLSGLVVSGGAKDPTSMAVGFGGVFGLVMVVGVLGAIFLFVRLGFLMIPVSVAEDRFGPFRSWELTRGNFWRIIGLTILIVLPLLIVQWIAMLFVMAPLMSEIFSAARNGSDDQVRALMAQFIAALPHYLIYFWAATVLLAPISFGLTLAPCAFAWRALQGDKADVFGERA